MAERLRAFTVAHRISGMLIAVVAVASTILDPGLHLPSAAYCLVLFALFVTHAQLPLLVAAWQAPDPPVDDEEPATDGPGQGAFAPPRGTDLEGRPATGLIPGAEGLAAGADQVCLLGIAHAPGEAVRGFGISGRQRSEAPG